MPIGAGQTISAPHMHAEMLELLAPHLDIGSRALDVGSGVWLHCLSVPLSPCLQRVVKLYREELFLALLSSSFAQAFKSYRVSYSWLFSLPHLLKPSCSLPALVAGVHLGDRGCPPLFGVLHALPNLRHTAWSMWACLRRKPGEHFSFISAMWCSVS